MPEGRDAYTRAALGALEALVIVAEDAIGAATQRAPVEEGTLRASGTVVLIVNGHRFEGAGSRAAAQQIVRALAQSGRAVRLDAELAFNTVYAARQHEELDWQHPKGGQAKYLESVILERGARYAAVIERSAQA